MWFEFDLTYIMLLKYHISSENCIRNHLTFGNGKGSSSCVGRQSETRRLADPVPLTLDLLKSKSIDFDRLSRTTTMPSFKSFRLRVFVLPPYYVVGVDNNFMPNMQIKHPLLAGQNSGLNEECGRNLDYLKWWFWTDEKCHFRLYNVSVKYISGRSA